MNLDPGTVGHTDASGDVDAVKAAARCRNAHVGMLSSEFDPPRVRGSRSLVRVPTGKSGGAGAGHIGAEFATLALINSLMDKQCTTRADALSVQQSLSLWRDIWLVFALKLLL